MTAPAPLREAIARLILAADSYGVSHLDSDDMSDDAVELQDATEAMKDALAALPTDAVQPVGGCFVGEGNVAKAKVIYGPLSHEYLISVLADRDLEIETLRTSVQPVGGVDREAELLGEIEALTKALTGLTCGGSEFFSRKGERYVADIDACVGWVRRCKEDAHRRTVDAILARKKAEEDLALYATAPTVGSGEVEGALLWFGSQHNLELSYGYEVDGEGDDGWQVHSVNGGRNDREWKRLSCGHDTPIKAIIAALPAAPTVGGE